MSPTGDTAQHHETRGVERGKLGKGVAYVSPGEGTRSLWVLDELLTYKVPSHQTGGAYSLFEATSHPGSGPPPHIHHREDESFYVLEGEYEFLIDGHTKKAGTGSLLCVPKGVLHAHRIVGDGPGKMLLIQTPGGLYEHFFEKAGRPANHNDDDPPFFEERPETERRRIAEVAAEHGTEIPPSFAEESRPKDTMEGGRR
jgi:quercetin dioxygenase-like cupin family protein